MTNHDPRPVRPISGPRVPAGIAPVTLASGGAAEVLGRDRVEELTELLDLVLLLVGDRDAGLLEDFVSRENRGAGPERQGYRVRRPRADLLAVREDQVREEGAVPQRGDVHRAQLNVQRLEDVPKQVM